MEGEVEGRRRVRIDSRRPSRGQGACTVCLPWKNSQCVALGRRRAWLSSAAEDSETARLELS